MIARCGHSKRSAREVVSDDAAVYAPIGVAVP
jgi:hypothetical protein